MITAKILQFEDPETEGSGIILQLTNKDEDLKYIENANKSINQKA